MKSTVIIAVAIGVLVAIGVAVIVVGRPRKEQGYVVPGEELAKAQLAEQARKRKGGTEDSPMPAGEYDRWRGEQSLVNPTKNSFDSELSDLCQKFAKSDSEARAAMRNAIRMDEFYTLLTFGRRAAVFAIREQNVDWIKNGLTAVAIIEAERIDYRDILMSVPLLYYAAKKIGANAEQLVRDAAELSEPNVKKSLIGFISRPDKEKETLSSWRYDEVQTAGGVGFIGRGFDKYQPTIDLKKIVIDLGDVIAKDKYQPSLEVASDLPPVWLKSDENPTLESVLKRVRAGASIHGYLRPNEHPSPDGHVLMLFLVETEDPQSAQELLAMSKRKRPDDYSMLGVSEGRLFCLVIGRSSTDRGVTSFETPEKLQRFAVPFAEILKKFS